MDSDLEVSDLESFLKNFKKASAALENRVWLAAGPKAWADEQVDVIVASGPVAMKEGVPDDAVMTDVKVLTGHPLYKQAFSEEWRKGVLPMLVNPRKRRVWSSDRVDRGDKTTVALQAAIFLCTAKLMAPTEIRLLTYSGYRQVECDAMTAAIGRIWAEVHNIVRPLEHIRLKKNVVSAYGSNINRGFDIKEFDELTMGSKTVDYRASIFEFCATKEKYVVFFPDGTAAVTATNAHRKMPDRFVNYLAGSVRQKFAPVGIIGTFRSMMGKHNATAADGPPSEYRLMPPVENAVLLDASMW